MKINAYCLDCEEVIQAKLIPDSEIGGEGYYQCCVCHGDNVTEDYHECAMCHNEHPDTIYYDDEYYCPDCIDKHAHRAIKKIEAWPWEERIALNIKYDGEQI